MYITLDDSIETGFMKVDSTATKYITKTLMIRTYLFKSILYFLDTRKQCYIF